MEGEKQPAVHPKVLEQMQEEQSDRENALLPELEKALARELTLFASVPERYFLLQEGKVDKILDELITTLELVRKFEKDPTTRPFLNEDDEDRIRAKKMRLFPNLKDVADKFVAGEINIKDVWNSSADSF